MGTEQQPGKDVNLSKNTEWDTVVAAHEREKRSFDATSMFAKLGEFSSDLERLKWDGSFREYMDKLVENPNVARSSHQSLYQAFEARPDYFTTGKNALYGAEGPLGELRNFLRAGNEGLQLGKRILLLVGGPGSGKSTAVSGLKRMLEEYSKTDEGAMYGIKGCELHEEPLHLIPEELRPDLEEQLGIRIEGDLCERCKVEYGDVENLTAVGEVPVERIFLAERRNVGISTFKPSDPKSQDISQLIGSVDLSKLGEVGTASDPRAYRFNGAIDTANRGLIELVELLKNDPKFLYMFLDLAQDRYVKAENFPNMSVDEILVGHTNIAEYDNYMRKAENEAIRDRTLAIWWKYPLKVSDEKRVYEKLIGEGELVRNKRVHVNPRALEAAANFSVLSRLEEPQNLGYTKIQKMHVYDGVDDGKLTSRDLGDLKKEAGKREGTVGISPRYVIDSLSHELVKDNVKCLTPYGVLKSLESNLDKHPHTSEMSEDERKKVDSALADAKELYAEIASEEIKAAFLGTRQEEIELRAKQYLENVMLYCSSDREVDKYTDEEVEPDEEFMESVEKYLDSNINASSRAQYRTKMLATIARSNMRSENFSFEHFPKLERAIRNQVAESMDGAIQSALSAKTPDQKQQRRLDDIESALIEHHGYCHECASELIELSKSARRRAK